MFGVFLKKKIIAMTIFGCNALKCVSINNQECKTRNNKY